MGTVNLKDSVMEKIDDEDKSIEDNPLIWDRGSESFSDHYQRLRTLAKQLVNAEDSGENEEVEVALDNIEDVDISEESLEDLENRFERIIREFAR